MCLSVMSCSLSGKKPPEKQYHRFVESALRFSTEKNLQVKRPSALGILGNRPMVVHNQEGALVQMQHNFWLESPKVLLNNHLQKVFDQSQIKDDTWVLETQILALEKQQQTAIVAIRFSVYDPYRKSMFDKTYRLKQSLDENSIAAFVQSVSLMIADITQQLLGDLP